MIKIIMILLVLLLAGCMYTTTNNTSTKGTDSLEKEPFINSDSSVVLKNDSVTQSRKWVSDVPFKKELFKNLNDLSDTVFIESRLHLERIVPLINLDTQIKYDYTTQLNNKYAILIKTKPFDHSKHSYTADTLWQSENKFYVMSNNIIDGKRVFGVDGTIPTREVDSFNIKINEKIIYFSQSVFDDLYNLNLIFTEIYESKNGQYLYIYLNGSDGAAGYSVKLIFSIEGYVTRICVVLCGFDFIDGIKFDCV
jgi:hypothetical protein